MGRSPGFGSTDSDLEPQKVLRLFGEPPDALFRLGFPAAPALKTLASPLPVTRRLINQKARRRQPYDQLRLVVDTRFQVLFHSPNRGAFHLSLTVLVHYRSSGSI